MQKRGIGRGRWYDIVPPPLWASWSALCAPDDPGVLPRLRGDTAARLAPDGATWPLVFLHLIAEATRAGSRTLAELRAVEAAGLAFAAEEDRRSRLPATVDLLLRQPALTAPALAGGWTSRRRHRCGCLRALGRPGWCGR
ncbi:MAG: hypothetical protein ACJ8AW_37075 [Rhodopila sp.]